MSSERTERATPRRRQEARRRGQVPRSPELPAAVSLLTAIVFLRWYAAYAAGILAGQVNDILMGNTGSDLTTLRLQQIGWSSGIAFARITGPLLGVIALIGVVGGLAQTGFVFSAAGLKPDFSRVNPAQGLKRILSRRGAVESGKVFVKLGVIGAVTYPVVRDQLVGMAGLTGTDPRAMAGALGAALGQIGLRAAGTYLVLAVLDYAYQRWEFEQSLRMTRQELREELRQTEGNPELKSRIRRLQRQMARGRMMAAVPEATVVLANPSHLAVAIRFEMHVMPAPIVVAKGRGWMAERIKAVARVHAIPVVENKPLAQALFRVTDVGMEIPVGLYEAVADVIAYVYRLRTRRI